MRTLSLTAFLLLSVPGTWVPSRAQALAPIDPAGEQIGFIRLYDCYEGAYNDYPPPCSDSVLIDADGTHMIPGMPIGAWSPDRTKLLQVGWVAGNDADIYVTPFLGATSVNLTNHPATDWWPAWSPDGTRVAFTSDRDGPHDLYVMNADGSGVMRIGTGVGMAWRPTWSPDSARLAFNCIVDPVSSPWWSATSNLDICVISADGSGLARLTSEPASDYDADWSPDGARILFVTSRYSGGVTELVVMNPDGSDVMRISPGLPADTPSWSSDGTRIAFVYRIPWDPDWPWARSSFVFVMNADGTGFTELGWGDSPVWKPWAGSLDDRPVASFTYECGGLTCTLDGSPSSDSDGPIESYLWQFGGGTAGSGATVTHTFAACRAHDFRQTVTRSERRSARISQRFVV